MFLRTLSLLLFLLLIQEVSAQKFTQGYYVNNSDDTIKTNLFLRKKNGEFTGLQSESGSLISKTDVKAVRLNDINYVVKIVTIDKSPKGDFKAVDTIIMEVMSREKMSLYYSIDEFDKAHYFIEDENGVTEELGLRILDQGNGLSFQELPTYKEKLKALFPGCSNLFPAIDQTLYIKKSIRSVYEKLYVCKYGSKPKTESVKGSVSDFGVTAGISSTKLSFTTNTGSAVASTATWNRTTAFTGGIYMDTRFARTGQLFSLRHELMYRSYDATAEDLSTTPNYHIIPSVSASYLKYNLIGRLALSHGALKPFLTVGLPVAYLLKSKSSTLIIDGANQNTVELLGKPKSLEFGFVGGGGFIYNGFSIEARFEQTSGLDPEKYASKVNTLYMLLSYRITHGKTK